MSLIKIAANAYMKRITSGSLSKKSLDQLKPVMRSSETMLNGFKKGTKNIAERHGINIKTVSDQESKLLAIQNGGYTAVGNNVLVHGGSFLERLASPAASIFKKEVPSHHVAVRHEVDEILERGKGPLGIVINKNKVQGIHEGLGVLSKERRNVHALQAHGVNVKHLANHRVKTNEYASLNNETKLSKVRKLKPNSTHVISTAFGRNKYPVFDVSK